MSAGAILKLQSVGFSAEQVGALAEFIDSQSAAKPDLEATEHRLESKIEALKTQIAESEATVIRWFVLTAIASATIGAAVAGFTFKPIA
jgi:DNA-binding transcriptional MerR regulator